MPIPLDLAVCNEALAECPQDPIQSPSESSLAARECVRAYDAVMRETLSTSDWECARRRIVLSVIDNDRPGEWGSAYQLPGDCLFPLRLAPNFAYFENDDLWPTVFDGGGSPVGVIPALQCLGRYEIASGTIYTNESLAVLEYTSFNAALFTPLLRRATVLSLAARIVLPITKDQRRQQQLVGWAMQAMQIAMADNFNRQPRRYYTRQISTTQTARDGFYEGVI